MLNKATDLIAKLLATEDLTVVHDSVGTASFNIKTRTLTLPIWKEATDDLIGMLVGHEVGHALFTTEDYYTHKLSESPVFQGYLNVLEDVRIEKLMKRKYPGLRKTFMLGYQELNNNDFFEVKNSDFNDMLLIDKINLYFKAGYNCGVAFDPFEKTYVDRAERTETIQEVIKLAQDIWEYTKQQMQKQQQATQSQMQIAAGEGEDTDDGDDYDQDMGSDGEESTGSATGSKGGQSTDDSMASKTEKAYSQNISDMADTSVHYKYWTPGKFFYDPFVSYKELQDHLKMKMNRAVAQGVDLTLREDQRERVATLRENTTPIVNYLYKEFEMKKAATAYKRTTIAKTGQLDMRKIYSYKLKDDIFKRVSSVQNGKNHGMIFLLDWSGSMHECLDQTLDQVVNLVYFCRKAQIPFQVLAFSDAYKNKNYDKFKSDNNLGKNIQAKGTLEVSFSGLSLLELFSSKMSSTEMNNMINHFKAWGDSFLRLGGTPLNEALNYMVEYIGAYQKKNNVEKLTFITLTDGEGHTVSGANEYIVTKDINGKTYKHFLRDENSKKNYHFTRDNPSSLTSGFLNIIKDRYDCTVLGFYLCSSSWSSIGHAIWSNYPNIDSNSELNSKISQVKKQIKQDGYGSVKGTGRDDLFIVPLQSTKVVDQDLSTIKGSASAASISSQFGKIMNKRKTSRILLSRFIDYVA